MRIKIRSFMLLALIAAVPVDAGAQYYPTPTVGIDLGAGQAPIPFYVPPIDPLVRGPDGPDSDELPNVFDKNPDYEVGADFQRHMSFANPIDLYTPAINHARTDRATPVADATQVGSRQADTATRQTDAPATAGDDAQANGDSIGGALRPSVLSTVRAIPKEVGAGLLDGFTRALSKDLLGTSDPDAMTKNRDGSDPVDHGTGDFQLERVDLVLSGVGIPFELKRRYRSHWSYDGPIGANWMHGYDQALLFSYTDCGNTVATWQTGDASTVRFERDAYGVFESKPSSPFFLGAAPTGYFVESPDGIRRSFDADGLLSEIRDLNGNHMTFTWSRTRAGDGNITSARLLSAVDTLGRTINFYYGSDGKLDRVDVPSIGRHVDYEIDARGDLISATNAGGIVERYDYDFGHVAAQPVVPTLAIEPFCKNACGFPIDTCGGPCADVAADAELSCMSRCYDPNTCDSRCASGCDAACAARTEGSACVGECQDLCTRGCTWNPDPAQCRALLSALGQHGTPELTQCLKDHSDPFHPYNQPYGSCESLAPGHSAALQMYSDCLKSHAWQCTPTSGFDVSHGWTTPSCYSAVNDSCAVHAQPGNLPQCDDQASCEDLCTDTCRENVLCEEFTENQSFAASLDPTSAGISFISWFINVSLSGPGSGQYWTGHGCVGRDQCLQPSPAPSAWIEYPIVNAGYWDYEYHPRENRGLICNLNECLDCCLNGEDCPENSRQRGRTCQEHCRASWQEECHKDLQASCDGDCTMACPHACGMLCAADCTTECTRECRTKAPCHELCGSIDFLAECRTGCYDKCVEDNTARDAQGNPITIYGNEQDLNHNLLHVIDGENRIYLTNTYETFPQSSSFDQVRTQVFGADAIRMTSYDLKNSSTPIASEDQALLATLPAPLDLCPLVCSSFASPGITGERWVQIDQGEFLVFLDTSSDPLVGIPFLGDPVLDGFSWYELRREGPGLSIDPPVKLPAGGITIETRSGSLFLRSSDSYRGAVVASGVDQATIDALFGSGRALSLIRTQAGWRAFDASAALLVRARGTGRCAAELGMHWSEGSLKISPEDACQGELAFVEEGRRPGEAHRGLATAPKQELAYAFTGGHANPISHNERSDSFDGDTTWGRSCVSTGSIDPAPECIGARTSQASMGGPAGFDCALPWSRRGAPTSPGIGPDPHPSAPDLTMECGGPIAAPLPRCEEWSFAAGPPIPVTSAAPYARVSIVRNVDALGPGQDVTWLYFADENGRIITVKNVADNSREDFQYDLDGRLEGTLSRFGDRTCRVYDQDWNVVQSVRLPAVDKWAPIERIDKRTHFGAHARPEIFFDPNSPTRALATYAWSPTGNLDAIHYPDPHDDVTFTSDPQGRPRGAIYPNGLLLDYGYDPATGALSSVTRTSMLSHEVAVTELEHDVYGNITHTEDLGKPTADYQYSADGRILSKTITLDPSGGSVPLTTDYFYNDAGELETELGPEVDRSYVFTLRGLLERIDDDPHGPTPARTECMRYDHRAQLVERVDGEGRRTYFDRDALGNVTHVRRGIPATPSPLAWDDGCPVRDGAAAGEQLFEEILYDRGLPATINRGFPNINLVPLWSTRLDYDGFGRLYETRLSNDTLARTALDARDLPMFSAVYGGVPASYPPGYFGWLPDTTDVKLASLQTNAFDHLGRLTERRARAFVDESAGRRLLTADGWLSSTYQYDASIGRVVITDPAGQIFETRADAFGRPLQTIFHDAQSTVVDYLYADHGREISERMTPSSAEGGRFLRVSRFNDAGRLVSVQAGADVTELSDYDDFGRLIYSDNRLERRTYRWNAFGELLGVDRVHANGTTEGYLSYSRNALGAASSISDAVAGNISHTFDFANRLSREEYADHSAIQHGYWMGTFSEKTRRDRVGNTVTTTYDDFGLPSRIEGDNFAGPYAGAGASVITLVHGPLGLSVATAQNKPGDATDDVTLTFVLDSLGRVSEERSSLFSTEPVRRTLDNVGRALDVAIASNSVHHDFDPFDRLTRVRLNSADIVSLAYNGHGAPSQMTYGNNLVETHTYDDEGRPRTVTIPQKFGAELYYSDHGVLVRHDRWIGTGARTSRLFRHDDLGRLQDAWTKSGLPTTGFTSGQITDSQLTGWTTGATRNESYALNAADSWSTASYGTTNLPITLGTVDQRYLTFNGAVTTDADARTTALPDGRQYSYDALDRALGARTAQNQAWKFQYDAFGRIVAWIAAGTTTKLQYAGSFIREVSGATETLHILGSDGAPVAIARGATKYFDHQSYGGRIDYATNSSGNIAERYNFSAYARLTFANASGQTISASAIGNRFLLNGQPYFTELASYRLGHRFYLPEHGRFTSPDALGFVDGPNILAYAGAQPIAYADPSGFDKANVSPVRAAAEGWGLWLGEHAVSSERDALTTLAGPLVGGAVGTYNAWNLGNAVGRVYEKDGVNGAVNLFNPASGALTNGYETKVALEEGDVAGAVYHGINTGEKAIDTVMMATAIFGVGKGGVEFLRGQGASPKFVHDQYLEYVRPGAKGRSFSTSWSSESGLGSRVYDDFAKIDGKLTGFEANTTPWAHISEKKFDAKLQQIGADVDLLDRGDVHRVIWFGNEPFPATGLGAELGKCLSDAGIEYWVVPWNE